MSSIDTMRRNKTAIIGTLSQDRRLILNKVHEKNLITEREYNNLKDISRETTEGHVVELVDKIMDKGEKICQKFLNLLQTDEAIKTTFPTLQDINLGDNRPLTQPVQASSPPSDVQPPGRKSENEEDFYELKSQPTGLCFIINNKCFQDGRVRNGTDKDASCLAEEFSSLGFRVLMCEDQTKDQMERTLMCVASLSDLQLNLEFHMKEWSDGKFTDPQQGLQHGDAFICCILSHGDKGVVLGVDSLPLPIETITSTFKPTEQSALAGKPKVFLIQACQGRLNHPGVRLEADDCGLPSISQSTDVLVAVSTVEDFVSYRDKIDGSWFIQSLCHQLQSCCPGGEDFTKILHCVNSDVSRKEGTSQPGQVKQLSRLTSRLTKTLVLSPRPK